jgi:uncharacterized membrane protein
MNGQAERDREQWENPANWHGGWFGIYVAPGDSRVWVPKRPAWMGWTINLGHPTGSLIMITLLSSALFPALLGIGITLLLRR